MGPAAVTECPGERPISENDTVRLESFKLLRILDTPPEREFDDLTSLASRICETAIALMSLVDAHLQWFKSSAGISTEETPRDIAFCAHAILQSDLFVVPDALADAKEARA